MRFADAEPSVNPPWEASLRVLASGSSGNCSVLALRRGGRAWACLIDAGLSPRRTANLLRASGLRLRDVAAILLTHLDSDHCHAGWITPDADDGTLRWPPRAAVYVHERHAIGIFGSLTAACAAGGTSVRVYSGPLRPTPGVLIEPSLHAHDADGVVVFRMTCTLTSGAAASLGYATDVGRVTSKFIDHFRGVDVLAIESNYCPQMQEESDRPIFLKRRIMGGRGHLSNHEALAAAEAIQPRRHVVCLHLSRQCNDPGLVAEMHAGADYALTISAQDRPTRWIEVGSAPVPQQMLLF